VAVLQLHAVVVMTAMECRLEGMDADTFRFPGVPMRFLDLPDHARIHMVNAPFGDCLS
jgi:hypothetical protein